MNPLQPWSLNRGTYSDGGGMNHRIRKRSLGAGSEASSHLIKRARAPWPWAGEQKTYDGMAAEDAPPNVRTNSFSFTGESGGGGGGGRGTGGSNAHPCIMYTANQAAPRQHQSTQRNSAGA